MNVKIYKNWKNECTNMGKKEWINVNTHGCVNLMITKAKFLIDERMYVKNEWMNMNDDNL